MKRKQTYTLSSLTLSAVNGVLQKIGLRLDQIEGVGQKPDFHGARLSNIGRGSQDLDAVRMDQYNELVERLEAGGL